MKYLVFMQAESDAGLRLCRIVHAVADTAPVEILTSLDSLGAHLRVPMPASFVLILLAQSRVLLSALLAMKGLIADVDTILILPDDATETYALGCKLYPRFISLMQSDFSDVGAVLEKMKKRRRPVR